MLRVTAWCLFSTKPLPKAMMTYSKGDSCLWFQWKLRQSFVFWFKFHWSLFLRVSIDSNNSLGPNRPQVITWANDDWILQYHMVSRAQWGNSLRAPLAPHELTSSSCAWYMMMLSNGTFSTLRALFAENSPVTSEFPSQRPVTQRLSFGVFFDLRLNKQLRKQSRCRWFEMPSCSLWHHRNDEAPILTKKPF